jgi:DNA-binding CsgD family transcriptional regulator
MELAWRAEDLSCQLEARLLSLWTRVLVSLALQQPEAEELVAQAYAETIEAGALDSFVFAYRLNPKTLRILARDPAHHRQLHAVLDKAEDAGLAVEFGLADLTTMDEPEPGQLTRREQDVYALVAEGRTNREIAHALFISEATVKVHIRHILKKLQVRTRTEAAILASRKPLP